MTILRRLSLALFLVAWVGLAPQGAMACATCFGQTDSLLAQGMNVGILSLLAVILTVLVSFASFFVVLARRAAAAAAKSEGPDTRGNL